MRGMSPGQGAAGWGPSPTEGWGATSGNRTLDNCMEGDVLTAVSPYLLAGCEIYHKALKNTGAELSRIISIYPLFAL